MQATIEWERGQCSIRCSIRRVADGGGTDGKGAYDLSFVEYVEGEILRAEPAE
jgi:hypothetical protein